MKYFLLLTLMLFAWLPHYSVAAISSSTVETKVFLEADDYTSTSTSSITTDGDALVYTKTIVNGTVVEETIQKGNDITTMQETITPQIHSEESVSQATTTAIEEILANGELQKKAKSNLDTPTLHGKLYELFFLNFLENLSLT